MHDAQLSEHGGLAGIRDPNALESALARPLNLFRYKKCDLADLAAAYAHGIVKNHPFNDGNKRAGFIAAAVFLDINGVELTMSEPEATLAFLGLADGSISQHRLAELIRQSSRKVPKKRR